MQWQEEALAPASFVEVLWEASGDGGVDVDEYNH